MRRLDSFASAVQARCSSRETDRRGTDSSEWIRFLCLSLEFLQVNIPDSRTDNLRSCQHGSLCSAKRAHNIAHQISPAIEQRASAFNYLEIIRII